MKKHQGFTVWFTGIPCCGKTTIADQVATLLKKKDYTVERLDGDVVRQGLTSDLGFSKKDRDENIRRITFVAKMLTRNNVVVLATFVSPYREQRRNARKEIERFVEVYVRCPVEICMKRDAKGMYRKALEGKIKHFTGVDDPYEEPEHPELILNTDTESLEESVKKVMHTIEELGYITW
ncbi:MAG: adenylyl-sulfate kinase [Thermoplasmata archaeon]|nr:adenylyl-sulfate kinase [Thermoplasmata archaeon]MBE3137362.1 adenylyl-sulfate kinase [Thermoplasmata archaeon]